MRTKAEIGVGIIVAVLLLMAKLNALTLERRLHEATVQRDSIAADAAAERARTIDSLEVVFAEEKEDLAQALAASDSTLQRVLADYRASRIEVTSYMQLLASAEGEITSLGKRVDSLLTPDDPEQGQWAGSINDGVLRASWSFVAPPAELGLNYFVSIGGELIQATTGDGRMMVTARATHPRATLRVPALFFDPPPPVVVTKTNWKRLLVSNLLSVAAGGLLWEFAR